MTFVSYSQNSEDVVLWRALGAIEHGFYIDVGAADPNEQSVTRAFYERGWSGINIEPLEDYYRRLQGSRPRDSNFRIVIGARSGLARLHVVAGTGLSTVDHNVAHRHADNGWEVSCEMVPQLTLTNIMEERGVAPIHFLKIDVEGAERAVLEGSDFARFRPWVVVVEATAPLLQQDTRFEWEDILLRQGYRATLFDGLNAFYVAEEHPDVADRLRVAANVFDNYTRVAELEAVSGLEAARKAYDADLALQADRHQSELNTLLQAHAADLVRISQEATDYNRKQDGLTAARREQRMLEARQAHNLSLSRLRMEYDQLQDQRALLDYRLQATLMSHSWRMTAPIRRISHATRNLLRIRPRLSGITGRPQAILANAASPGRTSAMVPQTELSRTASIVLDRLAHRLACHAVV